MDLAALQSLLGALPGTRVACVGDLMVDRFVYGTVSRVSPEAPIPVLARSRELKMLGGAGNVARNVAALSAEHTVLAVDIPGFGDSDVPPHTDPVAVVNLIWRSLDAALMIWLLRNRQ